MYIIPHARPWPGINRKRSLFPRFRSRVSAFSRLKLTSVTNSQLCRWSHAGPTRIASLRLAPLSHPHTHTHTLSLSLSQQQWDNNHAHRPLSSPARVLISGTSLGSFDLITLSNLRVDSNSAIQRLAPLHYFLLMLICPWRSLLRVPPSPPRWGSRFRIFPPLRSPAGLCSPPPPV